MSPLDKLYFEDKPGRTACVRLLMPLVLALCLLLLAGGCDKRLFLDYRPLTKAGMSSSTIEQFKKLKISETEIPELVAAKHAGINDDLCVSLVTAAHEHHHAFTGTDSASNLAGASFSESQILEIARADKLDTVGADAVTYHLIGLSDSTVQTMLQRRLQDQPTISSGEIARMKNAGLTEAQILDRINQGWTDETAEKEVTARVNARNHYGTGFTRIHGRRH
jgi:hypothetical protein